MIMYLRNPVSSRPVQFRPSRRLPWSYRKVRLTSTVENAYEMDRWYFAFPAVVSSLLFQFNWVLFGSAPLKTAVLRSSNSCCAYSWRFRRSAASRAFFVFGRGGAAGTFLAAAPFAGPSDRPGVLPSNTRLAKLLAFFGVVGSCPLPFALSFGIFRLVSFVATRKGVLAPRGSSLPSLS